MNGRQRFPDPGDVGYLTVMVQRDIEVDPDQHPFPFKIGIFDGFQFHGIPDFISGQIYQTDLKFNTWQENLNHESGRSEPQMAKMGFLCKRKQQL